MLTAFANNLEMKVFGSENNSPVAIRVFVVSRPASWEMVVLLLDFAEYMRYKMLFSS